MLRTISGQTGRDAYMFELAQIANARNELDRRMSRLIDAISADLPENATGEMSIASEQFPNATLPLDRAGLVTQLDSCRLADRFSTDYALDLVKRLHADPVRLDGDHPERRQAQAIRDMLK
jgi:hypothetical protein